MVIPTLKTCFFEASEDIMTKFKSQALHIIRIKYWKASGSGNHPSLIPNFWTIVILGLKTGLWEWYTGISVVDIRLQVLGHLGSKCVPAAVFFIKPPFNISNPALYHCKTIKKKVKTDRRLLTSSRSPLTPRMHTKIMA